MGPLVASEIEEEKSCDFFHNTAQKTLYLGAGSLFKSASYLARVGWSVISLSSIDSRVAHECLLLSELTTAVSDHFFAKDSPPASPQSSWLLNEQHLSTIPGFSEEEKALLTFLKHHFLAKSTGFFPSLVRWVYPRFGVHLQVQPETTCSYARSPFIGLSKTYQSRVEDWKLLLPHPKNYPLILTRPTDLGRYLPSYYKVESNESIEVTVEKVKKSLRSKVILDLTSIIPNHFTNSSDWTLFWEAYQHSFLKICKQQHVNPGQILFMQKVEKKEIGGIRILPLWYTSKKEIEQQHRFLLNWVSTFGLSANRIELDRVARIGSQSTKKEHPLPLLSKESFIPYLNSYESKKTSSDPQKLLMIDAAVSSLKTLFQNIPKTGWKKIKVSPTKLLIAELSFFKIKQELDLLSHETKNSSFFDVAGRLEQIHAHLSALLEIFSPFSSDAFASIYHNLLTSTPENLKDLTSCSLHSSGMTSLAGIFQIMHKNLGKAPSVLYGENTYYECINAANLVSKASPSLKASTEDLKEADLILAQFNPVWKGAQLPKVSYREENISQIVRGSLNVRQEKPLVLAIDCTFDFIDSAKVAALLYEFQEEIEKGTLSVLCYRSGLKFDLFGMDNYCGAPFYMIHSKDPKWDFLEELLTDPVLQTDLLSLNWFCLAYQNVAPELELYRKQIFDNTQKLLDKIPERLLSSQDLPYKVIPFEKGVAPTFIDITVTGPLHKIKAGALISGLLTLKCVKEGFPLFYRTSVGFYHTNLTQVSSSECSTVRLTLGLDPAQVDVLADCFKIIDRLNKPL
jgi:hypothetical protein